MSTNDTTHTIENVEAVLPASLRLAWSGGISVELNLAEWLKEPALAALRDPDEFSRVGLGDWGHSLEWSNGVEIGADSLWLETLSALKKGDTRRFLEWRLKHGLSLTKAAEALGLSRRMVAYYSNAEKPVPHTVLLACLGWEVSGQSKRVQRPSKSDPGRADAA
jgi:hypothetical protein